MANIFILTLTDCAGNGDSRLLKEARTLSKAGHYICIIASGDIDTQPYEDMDGLRIFRVKSGIGWLNFLRKLSYFPPSDVNGMDVAHSEMGEQEPSDSTRKIQAFAKGALICVRTCVLRLLRTIYRATYAGYIIYYYRSFRLVRKEPADVYHAHDLRTLPVAWLLKILTKGKVVYDCHELWLDRNRLPKRSKFNRFLVNRIESFLIRRADFTITVNESISRVLGERYRISPPIVIMNAPDYHPVNRSTILRDNIEIPDEDKIILYIGAITFGRGLEELVHSIKYLNSCSLVLMGYGDADYTAGLKKLIKYEGLVSKIHFFGPVPHDEVTKYAASADLGVVPIKDVCLSYYYCSPNKVFECMAAGLPVVGSDFPELKRIIEGNRLGVTFDPESPQDIARAINFILSDKDMYNKMSINASEASKVFNWQIESQKLIAAYKELTN